ncbi:MAG: hypothetical protein IKI84_13795 [Clostridia bacterium]|nr:hypothetical protein [Clostridia bacterium]
MKRDYETPTAEKLEFNYTDVVTASGYVTSQGTAEGCNIMPNGRLLENGSVCQKDPDRPKNKKCY